HVQLRAAAIRQRAEEGFHVNLGGGGLKTPAPFFVGGPPWWTPIPARAYKRTVGGGRPGFQSRAGEVAWPGKGPSGRPSHRLRARRNVSPNDLGVSPDFRGVSPTSGRRRPKPSGKCPNRRGRSPIGSGVSPKTSGLSPTPTGLSPNRSDVRPPGVRRP